MPSCGQRGDMRLVFHPLSGFTLLCAPLFLLLVGLGTWQLERLQWKLGLIAEITRNMAAPPIDLDQALQLSNTQYRRIRLVGRFENSRETYWYTTGPKGGAVFHLLTPFRLDDGREMIVDRGYVPAGLRDPNSRAGSEPKGRTTVVGIWRTADRPGPFTPAPELARRVWFARDIVAIARAEHLTLATSALLEATASPGANGWPRGGQTRVDIPNDHLQYALTWFLLAAALLAVYFAYHHTRGRLTLHGK